MAVTWDLELDQVGVGVTQTTGILVSAFGLTTLTQATDYRIRVRAVDETNGIIVYSPWTAWVDFTTQVAAIPITVNLGSLTNTQTLNALTVTVDEPVIIATTYDLELTESGESPTVTTGIADSEYGLTGLTNNADYDVRVRAVVSRNGVIYYSLWSDPVTFTAGQAVPEPITANLGSLVNSQTLEALTVTVDQIPEPILVNLGSLTNSQTLNALTVTVSDAPPPITVDLTSLTNSQTLNALTVTVAEPSQEVPASHWIVTLIDLSDSSIIQQQIVFVSEFTITGISQGKNYRVSVVGISDQGGVSAAATADFSTELAAITYYTSAITSIEQPLDIFRVTLSHFYNTQDGILTLSGFATDTIESMTGSFNGRVLGFSINNTTWESVVASGEVLLWMPEELDGTFAIQINAEGDTLGF